jgi:phage gp29-like protein
MSRHPRRFKFDADANLLLRVMGGNTMPLPDYKFLVFRPYARYENPYGDAGMRVVWWMTWFKRIVMNYWVRFTEVYVDPLAIAKPDKDRTLSEEERADMLDKFNHLQAQTGLIMPSGVDLIFREANRGSSVSAYRELIDFANAEISKAVIGQTLTTDPGHRGARSLGEVQQDVAAAYITQDAYALMALVNGTLLPWIHRFNIPNTPLPRMDINIDESVDKLIDAERYKILQELGLQLSVKDVMRKFNVKLAHSPEDILAPPPTPEIGRPKEPGASEK